MKQYNFDTQIERRGTDCFKWDALPGMYGRDDLLPMWVADNDWAAPDFVLDAMRQRLEHPVLGYTMPSEGYWQAVTAWLAKHYDIHTSKDTLHFIPGIVAGISYALLALTAPGDRVLVTTPVYPPFLNVPKGCGREVVCSPLRVVPCRWDAGAPYRFDIDFDDFERKAEGCKVFIMSNPHNPAGTLWGKETLLRIADICERKGLLVISDEIHADLTLPSTPLRPSATSPCKGEDHPTATHTSPSQGEVLPTAAHSSHSQGEVLPTATHSSPSQGEVPEGRRGHISYSTVSPVAARHSITFMAPSKTFNIAGLGSSICHIADASLRNRFFGWLDALGVAGGNIFAFTAAEAAFAHGEEWQRQMLEYLSVNVQTLDEYLQAHLPKVKAVLPEASYLAWLDFSAYGIPHSVLADRFINEAHVVMNDGTTFGGEAYEGCFRLNIGCPRAQLLEALDRIDKTINN